MQLKLSSAKWLSFCLGLNVVSFYSGGPRSTGAKWIWPTTAPLVKLSRRSWRTWASRKEHLRCHQNVCVFKDLHGGEVSVNRCPSFIFKKITASTLLNIATVISSRVCLCIPGNGSRILWVFQCWFFWIIFLGPMSQHTVVSPASLLGMLYWEEM